MLINQIYFFFITAQNESMIELTMNIKIYKILFVYWRTLINIVYLMMLLLVPI